jgi:hypothetical protein
MGMVPPKDKETHQICVILKGPVSQAAFNEYKRKLRECLRELGALRDKGKKRRLRVSRSRPSLIRYPPLHKAQKKKRSKKRSRRK